MWQSIGTISLLQVQTGEMTGKGSYDTGMLVSCDTIRVTHDGVFGHADGTWILDRHHRHHPASRRWHAEDVLSFGFTSHYRAMEDLFRPIALGIAGENAIVEADDVQVPDSIAGGLRIEGAYGHVDFASPEVAEPCVEFTRFMTERPDASASDINPQRQLLRNGIRGFVVGFTDEGVVDISVGDRVSAMPRASS